VSDLARPSQVSSRSGHVKTCQVMSVRGDVMSGQFRSGQVKSGLVKVRSGHVRSGKLRLGVVWSCQVMSGQPV